MAPCPLSCPRVQKSDSSVCSSSSASLYHQPKESSRRRPCCGARWSIRARWFFGPCPVASRCRFHPGCRKAIPRYVSLSQPPHCTTRTNLKNRPGVGHAARDGSLVPVTPAPVAPVPVTPVPVAPVPVTPIPVAPVPVTPIPVAPVPVAPIPVGPPNGIPPIIPPRAEKRFLGTFLFLFPTVRPT